MRRLLVVAVLSLFAAAFLPASAPASHDNPTEFVYGPPNMDLITGAADGQVTTPCGTYPAHFDVNGVDLNNPTGHFFTKVTFSPPCVGFDEAHYDGDMICVNANGPPSASPENGGFWRGEIKNVFLQPGNVQGIPGVLNPGMNVLGRVVDNWSSGADDRSMQFVVPASFPAGCPVLNVSTLPVSSGNFVVHDGVL